MSFHSEAHCDLWNTVVEYCTAVNFNIDVLLRLQNKVLPDIDDAPIYAPQVIPHVTL